MPGDVFFPGMTLGQQNSQIQVEPAGRPEFFDIPSAAESCGS
jgi:hypothetical protein